MKKLSLLLVALLCSISFYGQVWDSSQPDKRVTFGVRAGVNISTYKIDASFDEYLKHRIGFHAGIITDINIVKSFAIETGLLYSEKGFKNTCFDKNVPVSYLQIPIQALVRMPVANNINLHANVGGFCAYAVKTENYIKAFDAGLTFGAGISVMKIYLGIKYDLGLVNCEKDFDGGKTGNLAISLGYDF